jgi:hypothetical protein
VRFSFFYSNSFFFLFKYAVHSLRMCCIRYVNTAVIIAGSERCDELHESECFVAGAAVIHIKTAAIIAFTHSFNSRVFITTHACSSNVCSSKLFPKKKSTETKKKRSECVLLKTLTNSLSSSTVSSQTGS